MDGNNEKVQLSVSLTPEQKRAIDEIAERSQVSAARVIRQAISEFLASRSEPQLQLFDNQPFVAESESLKE